MGRSQKKKPQLKGYSKLKTKKKTNPAASARFRKITERAKKIRKKHPRMKWKNCIKQASKEIY